MFVVPCCFSVFIFCQCGLKQLILQRITWRTSPFGETTIAVHLEQRKDRAQSPCNFGLFCGCTVLLVTSERRAAASPPSLLSTSLLPFYFNSGNIIISHFYFGYRLLLCWIHATNRSLPRFVLIHIHPSFVLFGEHHQVVIWMNG